MTPPNKKKWKKKRGDSPYPRRVSFHPDVAGGGDTREERSGSEASRRSVREAPSVPSEDEKAIVKEKEKKKLGTAAVAVKAPSLALGRPKPKEGSHPERKVILKPKLKR